MNKHLVISISTLFLASSLALPALAAGTTATAGAAVSGTVSTPAGDASASASSNTMTTADVAKDQPFGDITVDQSKQPTETDLAALNDEQKQELRSRCDVVGQNAAMYNNDTSLWCTTYLEWFKKTHPAG